MSPFSEHTGFHFAVKNLTFGYVNQFPVSAGHVLIVPKREVATVFELTEPELTEHFATAKELKPLLDRHYKPDGYTIGWNVGTAGGQSVVHSHLHIIPRYEEDNRSKDVKPFGGLAQLPLSFSPNQFFYENKKGMVSDRDLVESLADQQDVFIPKFPVTPGHILIWPPDARGDFFSLRNDELIHQIRRAKDHLDHTDADGATLGWDVGESAGQMFDRPYLQLLPRFIGDTDSPRGGIVQIVRTNDPYYDQKNQGRRISPSKPVALRF